MTVILVSVLLALILAVAVALFSKSRFSPGSRTVTQAIAVALFVISCWLIVSAGSDVSKALQRRNWPQVSATVVDSWVTDDRIEQPKIKFRYQFKDREYEQIDNFGISGFGGRGSREQTARTVISDFPPGKKIHAFVDPDDPSHALLRPNVRWSELMRLSVGTFLLAGSLYLGLALLRSRKPGSAAPASQSVNQ